MKAKRILSLLLTVAMVAACGVTAFAGPTGYTQPSAVNAELESAMTQAIESGAAFADASKIRADFEVTKVTDEEVVETYGLDSISDMVDDSLVGKGWAVTISLEDIGTVVRGSKVGFLMTKFGFILNADTDYVPFPVAYSVNEGLNADSLTMGSNENGFNITYDGQDTKYANSVPMAANSSATNLADAFTIIVYAEDGTELSIDDAYAMFTNIEYKSMAYKAYVEGTTTAFTTAKYSLWVPTVTLSEGGDDPVITVGGTSSTEKDGVTITGTEKKYDNAYAVSATITATGASEIGVLFIPAEVLGADELTAANGAKAAYTDAAAIGRGEVTIRAAIKNIPRALEGRNIVMTTRAYALVGSAYTYGAAASETINFGDTGEVE